MRKLAAVTAILAFLLAGCFGSDAPPPGSDTPPHPTAADIALSAAVATLSSTLLTLKATGDLGDEADPVITATFTYGTLACSIVRQTPAGPERLARLQTELAQPAATWDAEVLKLAASNDKLRLYLAGPIAGLKQAARLALAYANIGDEAAFTRSCDVVQQLSDTWTIVTVPTPPLDMLRSSTETMGSVKFGWYPDGWGVKLTG